MHLCCQIKHSFCELLNLSFYFSYGSAANSKTIKNSRLVSQKDDVHVCIMCLRAIMNYQVQDAQTWLVTKTSGTSDLNAHRKEEANKNCSVSSILKFHWTWQVTCYSPECFLHRCHQLTNGSTKSKLNLHCIVVNIFFNILVPHCFFLSHS